MKSGFSGRPSLGLSGWPSSRYRQASNRLGPNPERLIDLRNCFGMIASVSTLARSSGATRPLSTENFSMILPKKLSPLAHVDEMPGYRGCGGHLGADQVRAPAGSLAPLKIAVRRGRTALARFQAVGVHAEAHRAARFAPFK